MSKILDNKPGNSSEGRLGANQVYVRNLPYDNAAAKFWSTLIDEVLADYPACDEIVLTGASGGQLTPDLLSPELALQRELEQVNEKELRKTFDELVAAMEIIGPPCAVALNLRAQGAELDTRELPLDCIDAEILPFLLAWLLEWANLAEFAWNRERVKGEFEAVDRKRNYCYRIAFSLANKHLSEGLFERQIAVKFRRTPHIRSAAKSMG